MSVTCKHHTLLLMWKITLMNLLGQKFYQHRKKKSFLNYRNDIGLCACLKRKPTVSQQTFPLQKWSITAAVKSSVTPIK